MTEAFDYVVVGAGSAGCVLASRLSEDEDVRVLLLEAGGSDWHPLIRVPLGIGKLYQHQMYDWRYRSEPEPGLDDRRLEIPRGKVLGGSSSINVMNYCRGDRGDFDRWAANGAKGWSYTDMLPYFKRRKPRKTVRPRRAAARAPSVSNGPAQPTRSATLGSRPRGRWAIGSIRM